MARKTDKQKAKELIDEVEHLFDRAQTPKAKKAWAKSTLPKMDEAIRLDPEDSRAWFHRGTAKIHLKDMGGHDDMRKAEKLRSPEPPKPKPTLSDGSESAYEKFLWGMGFIIAFIIVVLVI